MSSLMKFFSLTYSVSWTCFAAGGALTLRGAPSGSRLAAGASLLFLLGTIAPSLVALWLTRQTAGSAGTSALFDRVFAWRVRARWYVFALGYMATIKLSVAVVYRVITGAWPLFGPEPWYLLVAAVPVSTVVQAGEEIGWRGYALPRLATRLGFSGGSVLLGVAWSTWHLPLFFIPGIDKHGQSFPLYMIQAVALSVAMAWLYVHTNGSLLLTMLMHSAVNQSLGIVSSVVATATNPFAISPSFVAWLTAGLMWIAAGYFLIRMPAARELRSGKHVSSEPPHEIIAEAAAIRDAPRR